MAYKASKGQDWAGTPKSIKNGAGGGILVYIGYKYIAYKYSIPPKKTKTDKTPKRHKKDHEKD
jgi:hypothetical protein